ncbi:pH-response regulator protein palC [Ceratocystis fimbriata CBS 114723]|uniref:pH-response regulator protein palC n=2 Tax=Ceratocystis TaxID=5157 RepID=A0A2C5WZN8_9PEZI|nr:pH-response regulator protein palC [Ceratocystis fimbriata CBS 114723]
MPFQFTLPTTSAVSLTSSINCLSHPSLSITATTYRGVVRDVLKTHKRLPASERAHHVGVVVAALTNYLPYLLALDAGLNAHRGPMPPVNVVMATIPLFSWRPSLSDSPVPGREISRVQVSGLDDEIAFVMTTLASCYTLQARSALYPLYTTTGLVPTSEVRTGAIQTATRHLLDAASACTYLAERTDGGSPTSATPASACLDVTPATARALAALGLAEATLLAVMKDDPYPAAVAQDRHMDDREWMYKAPDIPKVRAHLFARLCLAAADHASRASALLQTAATISGSKPNSDLVRYISGLRQSSRAKACRFFGIDADLGGQAGNSIGWLNAGLQELGVDARSIMKKSNGGSSSGFGKLRREWAEKREDRRVEKEAGWGVDGGCIEETRVIQMLHEKWTKVNDTMLTQAIPTPGSLLAQMPSGREIHVVKPYVVPQLEPAVLENMRAPPDHTETFASQENDASSEDDMIDEREGSGRAYY